jgi:uncharacterized protein YrrD
MLIKGKDIVGLKVVAKNSGSFAGEVKELIYDPQSNRVRALLLGQNGLFGDSRLLMFDDITSIGKDVVIIETTKVIKKESEVPEEVSQIARESNYLTKTKIITEDGKDLGTVSDIFFDENSGEVEEMEVSQGLANLQSGKKRIKVEDIVTIGKDATIVKSSAEQDVEEQAKNQGVRGVLNEAKSKMGKEEAQQTGEAVKEKTTNLVDEVGERLKEAGQRVADDFQQLKESPQVRQGIDQIKSKTEDIQGSMVQRRIDTALGRYLTVNVLNDNDEIIGHRGDMVTHKLIRQSDEAGMLNKVLDNTSEEPVVTKDSLSISSNDKNPNDSRQ